MSQKIEIDGKKLLTVKEAARSVSYSRDYITRLAREKKIVASRVANQWFVDLDSLLSYEQVAAAEQTARQKQLSAKIKKDNQIKSAVAQSHARLQKKEKMLHRRSLVAAMLVVGVGLMGGAAAQDFFNIQGAQPATTALAVDEPKSESIPAELAITNEYVPSNQIVTPTTTIESLGDSRSGILLLPGDGSGAPESVFSDPVRIESVSADGRAKVVWMEESNKERVTEIPFLVVPVPTPKENI